jgi:coenzyme F420-0:L-glutamate ligase/coenzyme F420-1:gamma-L-glutamate ligase
VQSGDNLCELITTALARSGLELANGDVVVVAQKIVSKSEGRKVFLKDVDATQDAIDLAEEVDKDPRLVELILRESTQVVRSAPGVLIVRHSLGIVCANAGIDQSNIEQADGESALLLPRDPDQSAQSLRNAIKTATGKQAGVIISDSINRPWRLGTVGIAIGSAGVTVLDDRRGESDLFGRELVVTMSNRADSIVNAAMLLMGETTESIPVVLVRGLPLENSEQLASDAIRPPAEDLFL